MQAIGRVFSGLSERLTPANPPQPEESASEQSDLVPEVVPVPQDPAQLSYLSPFFRPVEHDLYLRRLLAALKDTSRQAPRNIALTGSYGSGKSSALEGLFKGRWKRKYKTVRISLATINPDLTTTSQSSREVAGEPERDKSELTRARLRSNLIQKEIVKQILYLEPRSRMSGSRFRRAERFLWWRSVGLSVGISLIIAAALFFTGSSRRFETFARASVLGLWPSVGIAILLGAAALLVFMRALHGRLQIKGLNAGPAQVELRADESAFDRYLDEIVHYFSVSGCQVAIIEDLDRFRGIEIYEELRALNLLLNGSNQIGQRVRFIYAMRDSLFEEIAEITEDARIDDNGDAPAAASPSRTAVERAADRAKFFDLVIPMVPFATLRTAIDLWRRELPEDTGVSLDALRVAATHIHDMRLIQNISNEFRVYTDELTKNRLGGYLPDQVFGLMLYKNVFLDDFEQIRIGKSNLDAAEAFRLDAITSKLLEWDASERDGDDAADASAAVEELAERSGEELLDQLERSFRMSARAAPPSTSFTVGGKGYSEADVTTPGFWRALESAGWSMAMTHAYPTPKAASVDIDDLQAWISADLSVVDWDPPTTGAGRVHDAEERERLSHAELRTLLSREGPLDPASRDDLADSVKSALEADLALDIVTAGLIGRNFSLYASRFYGDVVSAQTMNYLLHVAQDGRFAPYFKLDAPKDVESVLANAGTDFLRSTAVLNVTLFDALADDDRLDETLNHFGEIPRVEDFLALYLERGTRSDRIIARLASRWPGTFRFLTSLAVGPDERPRALDIALRNVSEDVDYDPAPGLPAQASPPGGPLEALRSSGQVEDAYATVEVLAANGVRFPDLGLLGEEVRAAAARRGLFEVSAENLKAALGSPRNWSLDRIPDSSAGALARVLGDLDSYLKILPRATPTLVTQDSLPTYVSKVSQTNGADGVRKVLARAKLDLRAGVLDRYPTATWNTLMAAKRVSGKPANLLAYARQVGIDRAAAQLVAASSGKRNELEEADKRELALAVIGTTAHLAVTKRVRFAKELGLATPLTLAELTGVDSEVLAYLMEENLLEDSQATFEGLKDRSWPTREAVIRKSATFPDYVDSLTFTEEDLCNLFASSRIHDDLKLAVVKSPTMPARVTAATANAIGRHLAQRRNGTAPRSAFDLLVTSRADPDVILRNLVWYSFESPTLNELLAGMPRPWSQLSGKAKRRPELRATPDMLVLLERLKASGTVSSYSVPVDDKTRAEVRKTS